MAFAVRMDHPFGGASQPIGLSPDPAHTGKVTFKTSRADIKGTAKRLRFQTITIRNDNRIAQPSIKSTSNLYKGDHYYIK